MKNERNISEVKDLEKIKGLKIAVCQMKVVPGRPDINANYMIKEIISAGNGGIDIIAFPEMCVPGYIIGDKWEDDCFIGDVQYWNEQICQATKNGIIALFGSVASEVDQNTKGEDGRIRKFNAAFVAQNGKLAGVTIKSLQPNYRIFDDDRHFFSMRKKRDEEAEQFRLSRGLKGVECLSIQNYLQPFPIQTRIGKIPIGVILCEDMWHEDYPFNPTKSLVENGAELIVNLSASPWTWQKNQKRHRVVKELIPECKVPIVYVNNTGMQNNGKNLIVYDGSSTIYDRDGNVVFEVEPYVNGVFPFELKDVMPAISLSPQHDTKELYLALRCGAKEYLNFLPPKMRKVYIGLSGGIDSGLSAAFYANILGPENVVGINMPSKFNSQTTQDIARETAENLGIKYEVRPIQNIVDAIAETTGVLEGSLSYENIQARARMEILAAESQNSGGIYPCNANKVELAFGYGTLNGDWAGYMAVLGDLVKREVYQLADYMNRAVYESEVIPDACFEIRPSAELSKDQKDPFYYGGLDHRGYHDEMVRAFTEFRKNSEWFLEMYLNDQLEYELKLDPGTLAGHFRNPRDFVEDLEKNWMRLHGSYFKRVVSVPVPVVSKRAFGFDLRESIMPTHFTERYKNLREIILRR